MPATVTFQHGVFQTFVATKKFHVGSLQRDIEAGEEIEFDGQTLKFPTSGQKVPMPTFRSVISEGWLVPHGEDLVAPPPRAAGIKVRPADELKARSEGQTGKEFMPVVNDEERVVTNFIPTKSGAQIGSGATPTSDQNVVSESVGQAALGAQSSMGKVVASVGSGSGASVGAEGEAVGSSRISVTASSAGRLKREQKQREREHIVNRPSAKISTSRSSVEDVLSGGDQNLLSRRDERRLSALKAEGKLGQVVESEEPEISFDDEEETPKKVLRKVSSAPGFKWDKTRFWEDRVHDAVNNYWDKPDLLQQILATETSVVAEKIQENLKSGI